MCRRSLSGVSNGEQNKRAGPELLTVEPVVIEGFSADVMLAAALDGCPEDRSVGSHKIDRGTRVQIPV